MVKGMNSEDEWLPCPPGILSGLAAGLRARERSARIRRMVRPAVLLLVLLAIVIWAVNREPTVPGDYHYGGISCTRVRSALPELLKGTADAALVARVEAHLAKCPRCADHARRLKAGEIQAARRSPVWPPEAARVVALSPLSSLSRDPLRARTATVP